MLLSSEYRQLQLLGFEMQVIGKREGLLVEGLGKLAASCHLLHPSRHTVLTEPMVGIVHAAIVYK